MTMSRDQEHGADVLVRCASHRARQRLFARIGRRPMAMWHPYRTSVYGCFRISEDELPRARTAKGVSRVRGDVSDWIDCV